MGGRQKYNSSFPSLFFPRFCMERTDADHGPEGISQSLAVSARAANDLEVTFCTVPLVLTRGSPPSPPHDLSPETAPSDRRLLSARFAVTPSRTAASLGDTSWGSWRGFWAQKEMISQQKIQARCTISMKDEACCCFQRSMQISDRGGS